MTAYQRSYHGIARGLAAVALVALAGCSPLQIGSRTLDFGGMSGPSSPAGQGPVMMQPATSAQSFGRGPVQVALLLPLSGPEASTGQALANASRLAIAFVEANPNIAENITISLRDSGSTAQSATAAASAAVAGGAKLILGPVRTDQVMAVGTVARSANVPVIGFAGNPAAAGNGVYLLGVLPDMEMKRTLGWIKSQGRRGIAGAFPATEAGQLQEVAFRQQAIAAGYAPSAVYTFSGVNEAQGIVNQALPEIQKGMIDTLYLPDRASAPAFGAALAQAGVTGEVLQIVGSAEWDGDAAITSSPGLSGAVYPAIDPAGRAAISGDYQRQFGGQPHPLATIAYTATILANVNTLSMATPPYNPTLMTSPQGFNGRDGVFRFQANGRGEYALVIKKVTPGAAQIVEAARL